MVVQEKGITSGPASKYILLYVLRCHLAEKRIRLFPINLLSLKIIVQNFQFFKGVGEGLKIKICVLIKARILDCQYR